MEKKQHKPALLLFPNLLAETRHPELFLPSSVGKAVNTIDGLIAESASGGKRYLDLFREEKDTRQIPIAVVNKKTPYEDIDFYLDPITKGERWGYVADAGLPCIADPGSALVFRARQRGIAIQSFIGPSALLLGLMQSGLPSQRFAFNGYLPKSQEERSKAILKLEERSREDESTQLFIEAPHRNKHLLEELINVLRPESWLCVAWQLTTPDQGIVCQQISAWKKNALPQLDGKAAMFYLYAKGKLYG